MEFLSTLHPKIVHFPIALFVVYALLEIIGSFVKKDFFSKTAHLILFLGVLGAVAAVLTGNSAEDAARALSKAGVSISIQSIGDHSDFANFTLWYFAGLLVLRTYIVLRKKFSGSIKYFFIVLSLVGVFLVYQTGELGGKLVYKYGIGTNLKKAEIKNSPESKH
ncbi:MAG: DUF2231 domain-containing protein [Bacteroidetes bacterium]|nr:DUF2231 domain-containing protein [Bacteroidota bacterium]